MERLKKLFMTLSLVFIAVCFGASIWLYSVLQDLMSIVFMVVLFVALVWFGINVRNIYK
ncbi:MAG: hypothetical protein K2H04_09085 [Bacteroidaceae bacterium]|nr:hypothetical protein [Bacteroidaceae bacterium]MDE6000202.1 hypothetical protein [Bacteroidaceae bacterium]MDE6722374.1 hypothetical protein [Bacteroidaceae bacterium]MDE7117101.1 hypothetical protein [Bacteroidaceae bacterium]